MSKIISLLALFDLHGVNKEKFALWPSTSPFLPIHHSQAEVHTLTLAGTWLLVLSVSQYIKKVNIKNK
jgi:hypothetical protein